jgi:hypothetical protein
VSLAVFMVMASRPCGDGGGTKAGVDPDPEAEAAMEANPEGIGAVGRVHVKGGTDWPGVEKACVRCMASDDVTSQAMSCLPGSDSPSPAALPKGGGGGGCSVGGGGGGGGGGGTFSSVGRCRGGRLPAGRRGSALPREKMMGSAAVGAGGGGCWKREGV